jgi:hypothetical protein
LSGSDDYVLAGGASCQDHAAGSKRKQFIDLQDRPAQRRIDFKDDVRKSRKIE